MGAHSIRTNLLSDVYAEKKLGNLNWIMFFEEFLVSVQFSTKVFVFMNLIEFSINVI